MCILKDFDIIIKYTHFWNWAPDWEIVKEVYMKFPDTYSVLTPFAYTYLEEIIRTTTSYYEVPPFNKDNKPNMKFGINLIKIAIKENEGNDEYIKALEYIKKYFSCQNPSNGQYGRNSVMHGHIHPRFWSKEAFEMLIHDIADFSKYAMF